MVVGSPPQVSVCNSVRRAFPHRTGRFAVNIRDRCYQRVEQYFADVPGTDFDLLQLTPGALNFRSTQVDLDGVSIEWNRTGASFRSREVNRGRGLLFGFVLDSPAPVRLGGQLLDYRAAVLWPPGREVDYITLMAARSLILLVDEGLLELLGWEPSDSIVHAVPGVCLDALAHTCRLATRAARIRDAGSHVAETRLWRERVLAALEPALGPWLKPDAGLSSHEKQRNRRTRRWLVKDADHWFEQRGLEEAFSVDAGAAALGVPRRTLFRAFREELGMGPQAYLQLVRLHRLRERLLLESPATASITALAGELGFTHMGRLSASYRQHFGEYPKETLRQG